MKLFQSDRTALAALAGNLQGNRLLRMVFPRDDGPSSVTLLANAIDATEGLSVDFAYTVEVLSDSATIEHDAVLGKMVTIEMVREDGSLRYFNGYVFEFRLLKTDGGFAFYKMVLEPWMAYLKLRFDHAAFQNLSIGSLTDKVCEPYLMRDLRFRIAGDDPAITYLCQHSESDSNFLQRHWEARGWTYHYEHRFDGHTLVLSDDTTRTAAPIDGERTDMPFQHEAGASEDDGIHQWSAVQRIRSDRVALASFNFKHPRPKRADRISADGLRVSPVLEVYEDTGLYGFKDFNDGEALAQRHMEEHDARRIVILAEGNDRTAQPGRWFSLSEYFSADFRIGGSAEEQNLIISVHHEASNNYQNGRGTQSSYRNEIECMPHNRPWRPGREFNTETPKIYGAQTALIVGPEGEDIYTDGFGRVKVQFHWDRRGKSNEFSSAWVRVASGWAGSGFGHISIPRIGMEVTVLFLNGNVDRPLIIGCLYNASNMPPWELPANGTQSGMLTRSSIDGSATQANALRFEDKRGQEEVWLHAEKDQRIEVEHDESHWVGHDRKKNVDHDETVVVKNDRTKTVGRDEKITVRNNRTERVDHNEKISVGDHRDEDVGKNEHVSIGGNRVVKIGGMKSERVTLAKEESIGLGKALTIGAVYQTTVGGAMNTTVALTQSEEIGLSKTVIVGETSALSAGVEHRVTVGSSVLKITATRIEMSADEVIIHGRSKVQIHGDDIDHNPG